MKNVIIYLVSSQMYNYYYFYDITILWRLPLSRAAGVFYLDVICIFKPSRAETGTSLASQAHANCLLPV